MKPYHVFRVLKPLKVLEGRAAPWFGQPGGDIQYKLFESVGELIDDEIIEEVLF